MTDLTPQLVDRLNLLAGISEEPEHLTRTFLSPAMKEANATVAAWMREAELEVTVDTWGNLIGRKASAQAGARTLVIGSHLDTVRKAGKFDGPLGVLTGVSACHHLRGVELPFHLEVVGFSDEEGTRFQCPYLGSLAYIGQIPETMLELRDRDGVTLREAVTAHAPEPAFSLPTARHAPGDLLGYVEVHLEQGPVLESRDFAVGVVDSIFAQMRLVFRLQGKAGHAGTTPMNLRRDALAGAAELISVVEAAGRREVGAVATVGQLRVEPGASNVIAQEATFSVDLRHARQEVVQEMARLLIDTGHTVAQRRGLQFYSDLKSSQAGAPCDPKLTAQLTASVLKSQGTVPHLASGAGHDGVVLARVAPMAMLFVRCRDGLSHHPDEHVEPDDIRVALAVLIDFIQEFQP